MKRYIQLSTAIKKTDSEFMTWNAGSKGKVVKASSKLHIKNSSIGSTTKAERNVIKAAEFDAEAFKKRHRDAADRRKAKKEAAENADRIIFQIRESDKPIITAHDLLVPNTGKAETLAGELVRAMMRLLYRDYNDGDVFYEGYGIETCGEAVAFLCNKLPDLEYLFSDIAERALKDDKYTNALNDIADGVLNAIYEEPSLAATKNTENMFDYDGESFIRDHGWEPTYDAEIEIPENVYAHLENGDISERDLEYEISTWDYCRDKEISVQGYYLTIYELGIDDYTEIDDNMYKWLEDYGNDLDDEYGVPDEEDDEYEEDEEI